MATRSGFRFDFASLWKDHPEAIAAVICGVLVLLGWSALQLGWLGVALLLLPAAYVIGGYDSAREGLTTLWEEKELDVDLLMIVAAIGAATLGLWQQEYFWVVDGAMLILIFAISGALEGYAMQRTDRSIRSLMSLTADTARVLCPEGEQIRPVSELRLGDRIRIKPGELVPTDGLIEAGISSLNQAPITGESIPVDKTIGDEVFAGTINGSGVLTVKVHKSPESSLIQRVIRLVEQAQTDAPPSQQFVERFERIYARVIVVAGILLAIVPHWIWQWTWEETIERALIFLVVASPCALVASIMPALLSGIATGAKQGILFKSGAHLEGMGQIQAIAFDKTGTLTTGQLQMRQVHPIDPTQKDHLLQVAIALESQSEHPIGDALTRFAHQNTIAIHPAQHVQAHIGRGITGEVLGKPAIVGKASFVQKHVSDWPEPLQALADQWEQKGETVLWVAYDRQILGLISVADTLRPEAKATIGHLKRLGIRAIVMLSGDNEQTARSIAHELGIEQVFAELLPEDKVNIVRYLQQRYGSVAMVGDGINDAPALAQASVGIAMGAVGSDIALETADVVLMADRLEKLEAAIRLGRRSQRVVKQNITFAIGCIVLLLIANFSSHITLPIGVVGHEGSTLLVTLSGLRLLRG